MRVRRPDSERLQSIANSRKTTVVEEFLRGLGDDYRRLREGPEQWEAYRAERREWDSLG